MNKCKKITTKTLQKYEVTLFQQQSKPTGMAKNWALQLHDENTTLVHVTTPNTFCQWHGGDGFKF